MYSEILLVFLLVALAGMACAGGGTPHSGVRDGRLAPCPDSPNCVSSQSNDPDHYIEPLRFSGTPEEALSRLRKVVGSMKRARIVESGSTFLHAEFRSLIFRFVDDVEFYIELEGSLIHVRSASRVGYSDLGANRRRVERIRQLYNAR